MNKEIVKSMGFGKAVDAVEQGNCPTCGKEIKSTDFKDRISIAEYNISGMCQKCQDFTFAPPPKEK